jgi:hypothetical protein
MVINPAAKAPPGSSGIFIAHSRHVETYVVINSELKNVLNAEI